MPQDVDDFLEHFGVKGMHWGVRKARPSGSDVRKSVGGAVEKAASKTKDFAVEHPRITAVTAYAAVATYKHRGELAGTAILAGRVGKYLIKQAFTPGSETHQAAALGRQVVQGFVVHG
jgi:hypothetical protein